MICVTGGAGFIGSCLVRELNERGYVDILIVDRLGSDERWKNLLGLKYSDYVHADAFLETCDSYKFEKIFHIGANSSTTETDVDSLMVNNTQYSQKMFALAKKNQAKFVYASSAATYGDGEQGYSDESIEGLIPLNAYAFSKHLFDQWMLKQEYSHWFGVKFFNVYGPQEYHKEKMVSVVYQAYHQIREKGVVKLFESHRPGIEHGDQRRDFIYVKDTCRAMIELCELKDPKSSGIYNLGTGEARSFKELVESVFKALNKDPNIEYIPMPEHLREKYQYYTQAKMNKFKELFPNFKFECLEEGIKDYVLNFLDQDYCYFR